MGAKGTIVRNVFSNWTGLAVNMMTGFLLMPFLIHRLGDTTYGFWVLIGSMTGYFHLMDIGMASAVGRYVAHYKALNDANGANRTITTSMVILAGVGATVLVGGVVLTFFFPRIFTVPPELTPSVMLAVILVSLNLAVSFPLHIFDGVLWGYQRFDLINAVDIPFTLLRAGTTVLLVLEGGGLVALASVTLFCSVGNGLVKMALSRRQDANLRIAPDFFSRESVRELFGFGFWNFLRSVGGRIVSLTDNVIIGYCLSPGALTLYAIGRRPVSYAGSVTAAVHGVMTPEATRRDALADDEGRRRLWVRGTRLCVIMAAFSGTLFYFLGRDFIILWQDSAYADASVLLMIIGMGMCFSMAAGMSAPILVSMAKHRFAAYVSLCQGLANLVLSCWLVLDYGRVGVALGTAGARIAASLFLPWLVCRLVGVQFSRFLLRAVLSPLYWALPCVLLAWLLSHWNTVGWPGLLTKGAMIGLAYVVALWLAVFTSRERVEMRERALAFLRSLLTSADIPD